MFRSFKAINKPANKSNLTPLQQAVLDKDLTDLKTLLKNPDVDVNAIGSINTTPLNFAIEFKRVEAIKHLLQHPEIDPFSNLDSQGPSLSYCVKFENTPHPMTDVLLSHDNIKVEHLAAALDGLKLHDYPNMKKLLKDTIEEKKAMEKMHKDSTPSRFSIFPKSNNNNEDSKKTTEKTPLLRKYQ